MTDKEIKWIKFSLSLELPKERVSIAYDTHDDRKIRYAYGYFQFHNGNCSSFWKDGNETSKVVKIEDIRYWMPIPSFDSLQEEPVSNPIDFEKELYKAFGQVKDFTLGMRIAKWFYDIGRNHQEPVSEDLDEAARSYSNNIDNICGSIGEQTRNAFKAGANWQKAKDESTTEDLGEYINELSKQFPEVSFAKLSRIAVRVSRWQKEQMMANAIDGITRPYDNEIWCNLASFNLKDGDKVKVIVIKEE